MTLERDLGLCPRHAVPVNDGGPGGPPDIGRARTPRVEHGRTTSTGARPGLAVPVRDSRYVAHFEDRGGSEGPHVVRCGTPDCAELALLVERRSRPCAVDEVEYRAAFADGPRFASCQAPNAPKGAGRRGLGRRPVGAVPMLRRTVVADREQIVGS